MFATLFRKCVAGACDSRGILTVETCGKQISAYRAGFSSPRHRIRTGSRSGVVTAFEWDRLVVLCRRVLLLGFPNFLFIFLTKASDKQWLIDVCMFVSMIPY